MTTKKGFSIFVYNYIALSISCSRCELSNYALKIPSQGQKSLKISHLIYVLTTELLELFKLRDLIKYYLSCLKEILLKCEATRGLNPALGEHLEMDNTAGIESKLVSIDTS